MQQNQPNLAPGSHSIYNYSEGEAKLHQPSYSRSIHFVVPHAMGRAILTCTNSCFNPDHRCSPAGDNKQTTSNPYPAQLYLDSSELGPRSHFTGEPNDTPRTLYLGSPGTEVGDGDIADQSDDESDLVPKAKSATHGARSSSIPSIPCVSAPPYTLGDLGEGDSLAVDETDLKCFTHRLHEDIKSVALFPWIPSAALSALIPSNSVANTQPGPLGSADPGFQSCSPFRANDDVTAEVGPHRTQGSRSLSKKASMHLRAPSRPINPFQRPSPGRSPPPYPYPAAVINHTHLRRYQAPKPPEQTISMKDLIVPNAEFHCGFDPETLVLELTSPPMDDVDYPVGYEESGIGLFPTMTESSPPPTAETPSTERCAVSEPPSTMGHDLDDDLTTREDDTCASSAPFVITPSPNDPTLQDPPPRRSTRTYSHHSSSVTSSGTRRGPQYSASKPRARHLQPNLVRNNGCQYGCQLLFSTAYEARRHQEDAHGREEAYRLMKLQTDDPNMVVYPREYRFLIQIGLHASGDKWDTGTKASFQTALAQQDAQLDENAASALLQFAKEWTKRYECPRCGTSFSRLDSKKRHFEKQCR